MTNKKIMYPQNQVFWYLKDIPTQPLTENIKTQVLIIGGGMAGLSAAQAFAYKGYHVTLIEKHFCGSGASGKSSGFITPNSELGLEYFVHTYGLDHAKKIWAFDISGLQLIEDNIKNFSLSCDYQKQDSLAVSSSARNFTELKKDHEFYKELSFPSRLYDKQELPTILGTQRYYGALAYPGTFGINGTAYCQGMKEVLKTKGVQVFEDTPALSIEGSTVKTAYNTIEAEYIVVCLDRFLPELNKLSPDIFHVQTFLLASEPLNDNQIKKIFPHQRYMVWDSELVYNYYRVIDGNRLVVGGGDMFATFWGSEQFDLRRMYKKLSHYFHKTFGFAINFEYMWPGLIGISKDLVPIATPDKNNPNIFYISAATGLPWAAALGWYSAERVADKNTEFDKYFSADRKFLIGNGIQKILGKRISFALSTFWVTR